MRFLLHIAIMGFAISANSQVVYMKEGKVYKDTSVYCDYKETGHRISRTYLSGPADIGNKMSVPEANNDSFKNIVFGKDYLSFVTITAKVFASSKEAYLVYYYEIKFEGLDTAINIRYNPMLIRSFVKDMVKYDIISGNFLNEKNTLELIKKWRRKEGVLSEDYLAQGVVNNYNSTTRNPAQKQNSLNIYVKENRIFRDSIPVATYSLDKHLPVTGSDGTSANSNLYRIDDTSGNLLAWVKVPLLRSVFFLTLAGEKESLSIVTTDRDEDKIIESAVKVLITMKKL